MVQERLQKLIAQAGIASRRASEEIIKAGEVTVNGKVAELGTKADPDTDHIKVRGKLINLKIAAKENTYILLNKPKGYLSSVSDPQHRPLVTDLIKGVGKLHPVGRLDFNTEGLIILTNDGDFTNTVTTSKQIPKVYQVKTKGMPTEVAIRKLRRGIILEDGFKTAPADIKILKPTDKNGWYEVTLFEGHNQQIRKMFDAVAHSVVKLKRIAIGSVTDVGLSVGRSRTLTEEEVNALKSGQSAIRDSKNRPSVQSPTRESKSRPSGPRAGRDSKSRPSGPSASRDSKPRQSGPSASRDLKSRPSGPSTSRDFRNRPSGESEGRDPRSRPLGPNASRDFRNRPSGESESRDSRSRPSGPSARRDSKSGSSGPSASRDLKSRPSGPSTSRDLKDRPSGPRKSRDLKDRPSGPRTSRDLKDRPSGQSVSRDSKSRPSRPSASRDSKDRPYWQSAGRGPKNRPSGSSGQRGKKGPARDDR